MRVVQSSMTAWSEILSEASSYEKWNLLFFYAVCHVKVVIKNLLGMTYAGQWAYATAIVPLCGLVWDCVCKRKEYIRTFVLLAIWILPFSMCILLMTDQGPRVSLAEPLSLAVLWTLWIGKIRSCNAKICFSMLLSAFVLLKAGYRITLIAEDEKNVYLSKMENLRALNVRLLSAADAAQLRSPRVVYFGNIPTHGHNYYKSRWNRRREESMLLRLPDGSFPEELTVQLNKPTPAEVVKYSAIITEMPMWPAPGCILVQDNVILLRFAD